MHQKAAIKMFTTTKIENNPNFITSRKNTLWCSQKVESLYTNKNKLLLYART